MKITQLANSGGEAKMMVEEGMVKLNGVTESRKRAKVKPGDVLESQGYEVIVEP